MIHPISCIPSLFCEYYWAPNLAEPKIHVKIFSRSWVLHCVEQYSQGMWPVSVSEQVPMEQVKAGQFDLCIQQRFSSGILNPALPLYFVQT